MKSVASRTLYPIILFGSLIAAWYLNSAGLLDVGPAAGSMVIIAALLIWAFEQVMPYTPDWKPNARRWLLDLLHSATSSYGVSALVHAGLLAVFVQVWASVGDSAGGVWWPGQWNIWAQLALAMLIGDLGAYTAHRLMHTFRVGWRLHAVHHSPTRMHFLAGGRTHPFNAFINVVLETGPVLLMGITPEAFMLMSVWKGVNGLLQHSNIDLRPGLLTYVVATNEVHWWHHSENRVESVNNFGNTTMVWDHVFRSFFLPADRRPRREVGIDNVALPESYLAHMAAPFTLARHEADFAAKYPEKVAAIGT